MLARIGEIRTLVHYHRNVKDVVTWEVWLDFHSKEWIKVMGPKNGTLFTNKNELSTYTSENLDEAYTKLKEPLTKGQRVRFHLV